MIRFQIGSKTISKVMDASKDSSFWLKETNLLSLTKTKNINQFTLEKDIWLTWKIIFNSESKIHKNKDKLFSKKILTKMLKFKDLSVLEDIMLIIFNHNQIKIKIKLTNLIRFKRKYLDIIQVRHFMNKMERSILQ